MMRIVLLGLFVFSFIKSLLTGSARVDEYGPQKWIDQDILVVTINYRLYSLGFMSLGTAKVLMITNRILLTGKS